MVWMFAVGAVALIVMVGLWIAASLEIMEDCE